MGAKRSSGMLCTSSSFKAEHVSSQSGAVTLASPVFDPTGRCMEESSAFQSRDGLTSPVHCMSLSVQCKVPSD